MENQLKPYPPIFKVGKTISKKLNASTIDNLNVIFERYQSKLIPDGRGNERHLNIGEVLEIAISACVGKQVPVPKPEPVPSPSPEQGPAPIPEPVPEKKPESKNYSMVWGS